jgi:hypothetical protein
MLSPSPAEEDLEALRPQSSAAHTLGQQVAVAEQPRAAACDVGGFQDIGGSRGLQAGAGGRHRGGQRLALAPQRCQWARKAADLAGDMAAGKMLSGWASTCVMSLTQIWNVGLTPLLAASREPAMSGMQVPTLLRMAHPSNGPGQQRQRVHPPLSCMHCDRGRALTVHRLGLDHAPTQRRRLLQSVQPASPWVPSRAA